MSNLAGNGNNSSKKNAATTPTATGAVVATPTPLTPTTTENLAAADLCADGDRRRYGHGCVADATAALACYVAAADAGYAPGCARAGLCFESASGVKPDSRAALHFYRRGVGSRDADSLHLLGRACETVEKFQQHDSTDAARRRERGAATAGEEEAKRAWLARLEEMPTWGPRRDPHDAATMS